MVTTSYALSWRTLLLSIWVVSSLPGGKASLIRTPRRRHLPDSENLGSTHDPSSLNSRWDVAHAQAESFLNGFTLEEKVNITTGVGWMGGRCVGNIAAQPDKGWPGLCLEDSPLGVRFADFVSAFPAGINTAATWNRDLMRRRGEAMGSEFRGKGVHIALGPAMNFARAPAGGRLWESFGADPYLQGEAAYETVKGIQEKGVQACAKHYLNNEQEHFRTTSSSNVDDRTQHEVYVHPFLKSVQAGLASIMCSYNLVNGTYACENSYLLQEILKHQLGFPGYVLSDWSATMSTGSAAQGLDMTMPGDITFNSNSSYFGGNLTAAVRSGQIPESRVDDMAKRIVAGWFYTGQDQDFPEVNFDAFLRNNAATNEHVDVQADHYKLIREIGAASTVLLKNVKEALPIQDPRSIAVIGSDAGPATRGPNGYNDRGGSDGTLAMGWGSGTSDFPYLITPLEAIQKRAIRDRATVSWWLDDWDTAGAATTAAYKDLAIVFIKSNSGEEYITVDGNRGDRNNLTAWSNGDELVKSVANSNKNTIVVVHSVGPIIMDAWVNHPNVTAVVLAGLPGQESGNSLVDVMYGHYNPSARLPYTIAKQRADYNADVLYESSAPRPQIDYTEGLYIDYRYFDSADIEPRYEFGFGLSYTDFEYSDIKVETIYDSESDSDDVAKWEKGEPTGDHAGASLDTWLHKPAYEVTFNVKNVGKYYGCDIPQLYLHHSPEAKSPPAILRGFTNVKLDVGATERATIYLSRYDLSVWDVERKGWRRGGNAWDLSIGRSSRDFKLKGRIGYSSDV